MLRLAVNQLVSSTIGVEANMSDKDESTSNTYHVNISGGQGIVIGQNPNVVQHFNQPPKPDSPPAAVPDAANSALAMELYQSLLDGFSLDDLRTLCFHLQIEYDDLPGEGRAAKARELVKQMQLTKRLDDLRATIIQLRGRL
jgi:hypothetical protein